MRNSLANSATLSGWSMAMPTNCSPRLPQRSRSLPPPRRAPPRRRTARRCAPSSPEAQRLVEHRQEAVGGLEADHAQPLDFAAFAIEENDARRAEQAEALEQRSVLGAVGGDVGLQQRHLAEAGLHGPLAEGVKPH